MLLPTATYLLLVRLGGLTSLSFDKAWQWLGTFRNEQITLLRLCVHVWFLMH